mmetsp:Transcript_12061/g.28257  ORF Transcript_12061/g.28257 Transcript_12061/m.28257 type:complete len:385 (-) Transcript_12061:167-1321(-)
MRKYLNALGLLWLALLDAVQAFGQGTRFHAKKLTRVPSEPSQPESAPRLEPHVARRGFISLAPAAVTLLTAPNPASADFFGGKGGADGSPVGSASLRRAVEMKRRPKPGLGPRPKLEQDFAVLLMRTSYNVADELDFVAMDQFQKDFFLFRSDEYLDYKNALEGAPMMQGDLRNAMYLDFISFAQHGTISTEMKNAKTVFDEAYSLPKKDENDDDEPLKWTTRTIRRDPTLPTNSELPAAFDAQVGDKIYAWLYDRYNLPAGGVGHLDVAPGLSPSQITAGVELILNWMKINGYMRSFEMKSSSSSTNPLGTQSFQLDIRLESPATLWSQEVLSQIGSLVGNAYEVKVILAYLRACGDIKGSLTSTRFSKEGDIRHTLTIKGFN